MTQRQSRPMPLVALIFLFILQASLTAQTLETAGRIEGRVGLINSPYQDEQNLVHLERIHFGIQQHFKLFDMNYLITGGGLYQGSSYVEKSQFLPEYNAKAQLSPIRGVTLELFSYSQQRNPMQIATDTLRRQEQVSGFQIESPISASGRVIAGLGTRKASYAEQDISNQFYKLQLEQKLLGLHFRLRGEKDVFSESSSPSMEDRSNLSVQWYGNPLKNLSWTSINSLYTYGGLNFWRVYQRLNYKISSKSTLWSHVRNQQIATAETYLNAQSFDMDYRYKLGQHLALQLLSEGKKVRPLEGDPIYHWRAYMMGLHWNYGQKYSALGLLQAGFRESYRFGNGLDFRFEFEERLPLFHHRLFNFDLIDYAQGELFFRMDDQADPRYDIDHELRLNLDFLKGQKFQISNTFALRNHLGTDLDFSTDTLRNALTHDIQFKFTKRRLRASLDHLTINEMGEASDLRYHLNSRFSYQVSRNQSMNLLSMYRYRSDRFDKYIWLNTFYKVNMQNFSWALELQAQGHPDTVFDDNLSIWMRFVRQL